MGTAEDRVHGAGHAATPPVAIPAESPPAPAASDALRDQLIATARAMNGRGINRGAAGNVSLRVREDGTDGAREGFLVTPTGLPYDALMAADIPFVGVDGVASGRRRPSSEWRIHRDIYAARPDAGAVVHAHSPFATALACLRREIPPFHYMIARFGGATVRCAGYALFGTQALSDAILPALAGRRACLMANHGMVVLGRDLNHALDLAEELETLCEQYWRACQLGTPVCLDEAEMAAALAAFADYGRQP